MTTIRQAKEKMRNQEILKKRIQGELREYFKEGFPVGEVEIYGGGIVHLLLFTQRGCVRIPTSLIDNALTQKEVLESVSGNLPAAKANNLQWDIKEGTTIFSVCCSVMGE